MTVGERIKTRRKELGMTAEELGDAIGRSRATIYKYEKGDIENLSHTLLIPLAEALHTTPEYLLGYDDDPDDPEEWLNDSGHILPDEFWPELSQEERIRRFKKFKEAEFEDGMALSQHMDELTGATSYLTTNTIQIPVLGSVPAGVPIEAVQDVDGYIDIPADWQTNGRFIALKVTGSSMYPKYLEGDIVVLQLQDYAKNHQDAVVYVNGYDATLKTVTNEPDGSTTLTPINPEYETKNYPSGMVKVLGVVKRQIREF